ncbi:hypothetical protein LTR17_014193 [Elasticomyces elasticus]|nr:hypothetical protein LTR17_014193 [Elasticomyces elasticus]
MQSISKLLAVCLAVGQTQLANAAPLEERSCDLNDVVRLSLRDPAFAEEWTKRCAQPVTVEQILEKRQTASAYALRLPPSMPIAWKTHFGMVVAYTGQVDVVHFYTEAQHLWPIYDLIVSEDIVDSRFAYGSIHYFHQQCGQILFDQELFYDHDGSQAQHLRRIVQHLREHVFKHVFEASNHELQEVLDKPSLGHDTINDQLIPLSTSTKSTVTSKTSSSTPSTTSTSKSSTESSTVKTTKTTTKSSSTSPVSATTPTTSSKKSSSSSTVSSTTPIKYTSSSSSSKSSSTVSSTTPIKYTSSSSSSKRYVFLNVICQDFKHSEQHEIFDVAGLRNDTINNLQVLHEGLVKH